MKKINYMVPGDFMPSATRKQRQDAFNALVLKQSEAFAKKTGQPKKLSDVEAGRSKPKSKIKQKRRKSVLKRG